ncbi:MAG: ribonuclease HII [Capnocytophaga sp.]|nr:ribonuclease HII [Capnocytophaga sp.]
MQLFYHTHNEAGTDEAGRGCLAGPVTAAAVILPQDFKNEILTDSKQLSEKQRFMLKDVIEREAISYAVAHVFPAEIDELNILRASIVAMHRALAQLSQTPDFIAVDGNKFVKYESIPHTCVVKGDAKIQTIAAASVLAKTYRDIYMEQIDDEYPMYFWKKNKGYPTAEHRKAIEKYGITPYHRKSFQLFSTQLKLEFE